MMNCARVELATSKSFLAFFSLLVVVNVAVVIIVECATTATTTSSATSAFELTTANLQRNNNNKQFEAQQQQQQLTTTTADDVAFDANVDQRAALPWSLPNRPSFVNIIRFPNDECFDAANQSGTCYSAWECRKLGGQPSSPCAAGFGACCIVSRSCHITTREKVVYFKNPSFPNADSDEKICDLTVEMSDPSVCQLRIDFLDFQLDPPTAGACTDDYMEISATGMQPQTVPRLCGLNRNQHLYINVPQDYGNSLVDRSVSIIFHTDPVGDHRWQLKLTQIDCLTNRPPVDFKRALGKLHASPLWNPHPASMRLPLQLMQGGYSIAVASGFKTMTQTASAIASELLKPQFTPRAPNGCLQYFNQNSGIIESFNFGHYLNNMDYAICIQRAPNTCRVIFTSSDYDWSINGVDVAGSTSGVGDVDCAADYLMIPAGSRTGDGYTYDRYCGGRLHFYRGQTQSSSVVIKTTGPIVLRFHSDNQFRPLNSAGFRLQFDQSAADCAYHTPEEAGSLSAQHLFASALSDSRPQMIDAQLLQPPLPSTLQQPPIFYSAQQLEKPQLLLTHNSLDSQLGANNNSNAPILRQQQQQQQQQPISGQQSIKRLDNDIDSASTPAVAATAADSSELTTLRRLKFADLSSAFELLSTSFANIADYKSNAAHSKA